MIKLKNAFYQITISDDKSYKIGSLKNRYYDIEFNPQNYTKEDLYKVLCIDVKGRTSYRFSLVGDCYTSLDKCAILENSKLNYGIRKITPYECLALQGFPKEYRFPNIPLNSAYKQCGNSVVVPVIRKIAERILDVI